MVDVTYIRHNLDAVKAAVAGKKIDLDVDHLLEIDDARKAVQKRVQQLQEERNILTAAINGKPTDEQIALGRDLRERLQKEENALQAVQEELDMYLVKVPTVPAEDTPPGTSDADNVEIESHGVIPTFDFTPRDHMELGQMLDIIDFDRGVKVAGFRGYYLKNEGVMLVMGLMMVSLEKMIARGYTPFIPPTLIKEFPLFGSGYFKSMQYNSEIDEIYEVATPDKESTGEVSKEKKFLVGTAEPSLLAYYSGETLDESQLPIKLSGFSQCYRSEIGSYGRDVKGMYRVHEFMKVEQVVLAPADIEIADTLQQDMLAISKEIHEELGLPYRVLRMCMGELTAGKYKQFDLEAWMPGMQRWAETGSSSNFLDWQSRRLNVRYKTQTGEKKYVYMLNNTMMPSPRPFIAILENFQQADGSVRVPQILQKYVGKELISPKK